MSANGFKIADVIASEKLAGMQPITTVGIDIGSRQSKAVMVSANYIHTAITASGVHPQETAARLVSKSVIGHFRTKHQHPHRRQSALRPGHRLHAVARRPGSRLRSAILTE